MLKSMSKTFLTGLITILPVVLTVYLLYWLVVSAETALGNAIRLVLPEDLYWPGMGTIAGLLVVFLVWARAGSMVHIFFPSESGGGWRDLAPFLAVGSAVGALFASIVFAASAFSLPMLVLHTLYHHTSRVIKQ